MGTPEHTSQVTESVTRREARATDLALQLNNAIRVRGVTGKWVARAIGCGETAVSEARRGKVIPTMETARAMADALDWPGIVDVCLRLRTRPCEVCGTSFVDFKRNLTSRTCSVRCRWTRQKRLEREATEVQLRGRAEIAENRLELYRNRVDAFCRECAPDGVCVDARCRLRVVSPLPLEKRRAA